MMRIRWQLAVGIVALLSWEASAEQIMASRCDHTSESFNCVEFVRNYDGDTFTVNIPKVHPLIGSHITVRVSGIDAPEMDGVSSCERRAAQRAQQEVEQLMARANRIDLRDVQRDKYFRVLADVRVDGESLAERLLRQKLAVLYDGGRKERVDWCGR